jgi:hypothetical protein
MKMSKAFQVIFIALILFAFNGCKDRNQNSSRIPFVSVNITIAVQDAQFSRLNVIGGWVYITGGSRGIIVYRKSESEFTALDRHSPYLPNNNCRVEVDKTDIAAVDSCSGSKFLLVDGSIVNGPSELPLQSYQTVFDTQYIRIFN